MSHSTYETVKNQTKTKKHATNKKNMKSRDLKDTDNCIKAISH